MAQANPSTAQGKRQQRRPLIVVAILIVALLAAMALVSAWQTSTVQETMDDAAYQNMETLMRTLASTVSSVFSSDQDYMSSLAATVPMASSTEDWVSGLEIDRTNIQNIYYCGADSDTAYGKNEKTLDVSAHAFTTHQNGLVRSAAYMSEYGNYVYLLRVPVRENGEVTGYLYGEFPMSRFYQVMPTAITDNNEISLVEAESLNYIQIPSHSGAGTHIGYDSLRYYLDDSALAEEVVGEIETAIRQRQYYMRLLTFRYGKNNEMSDAEYVVFLWPIDDGEYYLSGFSKVDTLQGERISVVHTVNLMVAMLLGISVITLVVMIGFFGLQISDSRKQALVQQKHNQELDEALSIAKVANQSKSNFLSNMSHDIRTPMNAIIGYTTLISKEADDPQKVREYTKKITGAGDYLLGLINDVLDMSKIESGKTTLTISQFRIEEMVNEIESIIRMQANANQQNFTVSVENVAHDSVMGDKLRIRQIILNLLSNALKYTPAGGKIAFTIQGIQQPKPGIQKLRIVVQDTGYGMEPSYLKTIFDPFTRLDNTMTGEIQGTGLGLAITKNIVDLMGGTITVNSIPEKGSTFTVDLELSVAPDESPAEKVEEPAEEIPFTLDGMHILAAEDNELNAEILSELLAMEGADCKICGDGEKTVQAFNACTPGTYDLILMDIQMPVMNGYEATKAIRSGSHPEAKTIPIVAMTANAFAEDVLDALQAGMDAHISKPVDMNTLKKTLSKVLKKKKEG